MPTTKSRNWEILPSMRRAVACSAFLTAVMLSALPTVAEAVDFITFESGPVRPVALTPDGNTLLAVNTPDNHLAIFSVTDGALTQTGSVPVGMEPVSVVARSDSEAWVVNFLSDSVSIVDLTATPPQVVRTLLVGDEPRDIQFAGTGANDRAFITTAHRGQQREHSSIAAVPGAGDPDLLTPSIPRLDVWVFDATNLGASLGGTPIEILSFFADSPRPIAVTADRTTVYVAALFSGNGSAVVGAGQVGLAAPGPPDNVDGVPRPSVGAIVKFNGSAWLDADGTDWSSFVNYSLPDNDVFAFDANTLETVAEYKGVGTINFGIAINPVTDKVYVSNTDSHNEIIFEGPGDHGGSTVQGQASKTRITVLNPVTGGKSAKYLNQHIDHSMLHTDANADHAAIEAQKPHSLATPLELVVSSDGSKIYMAAYGSAKVAVFDAADIEDVNFATNFDPTAESAHYISTGGGPAGIALDENNQQLYVLTRFGNQVEVIDLANNSIVETHPLHNPEPLSVIEGRPFLYDAVATSGNGEMSCASCHIFAEWDKLTWNLGNPDEHITVNSNNISPALSFVPIDENFHPMKGPMATQSLQGLAVAGGMHWRADRVDGHFGQDPCSEPTGADCSEEFSFNNFIEAFVGLNGKRDMITDSEMQMFTDFALQITIPPGPIRALDNSLNAAQQDGANRFFIPNMDGPASCEGCHELDPAQGFFCTSGDQTFEGEPQTFKVPTMRNMYKKVGKFGHSTSVSSDTSNTHYGDQIGGIGFLHDGTVDTLETFVSSSLFTRLNEQQDRNMAHFSYAFDTDLAPIVGQQVTLTASNAVWVNPRIDLMAVRAGTSFESLILGGTVTECDLVVKGSIAGKEFGAVRLANGQFRTDTDDVVSDAVIRALAVTDGPVTYTCVPPGSGTRMGINRDRDNWLDGQDNCPAIANDSQLDADSDNIGDMCDPLFNDADADTVPDAIDNCLLISNPDQLDTDEDGIGDACEGLPPGC